MSRDLRRAPVLRCLLVWSAVTAASALLLVALTGDLAHAQPGFDGALTRAAALALTACTAWLWLATTLTAYDAARGTTVRALPGCPRALRRVLMTACGVALAASMAPAHADAGQSGLPPTPVASMAGAPPTAPAVDVRQGDSLWRLAEAELPADASPADIERQWRAIWRANHDTVGADPDLILPGQHLTMPEAGR
jgi:nucleoid-associated protein YgaU